MRERVKKRKGRERERGRERNGRTDGAICM